MPKMAAGSGRYAAASNLVSSFLVALPRTMHFQPPALFDGRAGGSPDAFIKLASQSTGRDNAGIRTRLGASPMPFMNTVWLAAGVVGLIFVLIFLAVFTRFA